ncbi:MAG: hypothetical protein ACC628_11635, partial [Pirellulaceae bacterium]
MKWNVLLGTLVLASGLCAQSYGFDLLDRMLGVDSGCGSDPCAVQKGGRSKGASQKDGCGATQKGKHHNDAAQKGKHGDHKGSAQKDGGCDGKSAAQKGKGAAQKGKSCSKGRVIGAIIVPKCDSKGGKGGHDHKGASQKGACGDGKGAVQKGLLSGLFDHA